jgi:electron transfer flavoprotein alpha subunit
VTVLVHIEVHGEAPDDDALGILAAARAAGLAPVAVVVGSGVAAAVAAVQRHGPSRVLVVDHPSLASSDVAPRAAAVGAVIGRFDGGVWLAPTSTVATELAAVLSARLGAGILWGLVGLGVDGTATRITGNDTIVAESVWTTAWGIGLFRSHACDPAIVNGTEVEVEHIDLPVVPDRGVSIVERPSDTGAGADLAAAATIVAAGRGIGSRDDLELVRELAGLLGGVPAVSLPLVELGWAPRSMQVGQTGTIVAPLLYVACGISGQIQHRVGMERSGTIIAINTDADAPIMRWCDLAVTASAAPVLAALIDLLSPGRS